MSKKPDVDVSANRRRGPSDDWATRYLGGQPVQRQLSPSGEVVTRGEDIAAMRRRIVLSNEMQWREAARRHHGQA